MLWPEAYQQCLQRNRLLGQAREIDFMGLCSIWVTQISVLSHPKLSIAPITLFHISSGNVFVVFAKDQNIGGFISKDSEVSSLFPLFFSLHCFEC